MMLLYSLSLSIYIYPIAVEADIWIAMAYHLSDCHSSPGLSGLMHLAVWPVYDPAKAGDCQTMIAFLGNWLGEPTLD